VDFLPVLVVISNIVMEVTPKKNENFTLGQAPRMLVVSMGTLVV